MKQTIWTIFLIIIASVLTLDFSTFTHPFVLLTIPGFLFALALTIPRVLPDFNKHWTEIKIIGLYLVIWMASIGISILLQLVSSALSDKIPYIIVGLIAGLGISVTFDWQFGLRKRKLGMAVITTLSIAAILLGDKFFPTPYEKGLNIGKQIAIWQAFIGIGILITEENASKYKNNAIDIKKNAHNRWQLRNGGRLAFLSSAFGS